MEVIFIRLLNMSITAGWSVLGVVIARLALKKAPKWAACALWALVGVRLVCPFSFESVLSLIPSAETINPNIMYSNAPKIQSGVDFINSAVNPALSESFAPDVFSSANPMQIAAYIAAVVWLAGIAAMLVYAVLSYVLLRRRVAHAVLLRDNLLQSEAIPSPFALGFFRPRIYLPFGMDEGAMACVIAHEKAHMKRRDHLIKPIGFVLLTIYWFNPLIWLAYILLCRDIEFACDERVIKDMGMDGKKAYSQTLLSFGAARTAIPACPLAFGEVGVKRRVKNVLNYRKPAFFIVIAALIACAAAAVFFLSNPKTPLFNQNPDGAYYSSLVYMNPLSSIHPTSGTGCVYLINTSGNSFAIVNEASGEALESFVNVFFNYQSFTDEQWVSWFEFDFGVPKIHSYENKRMLELSGDYRLLDMDGELWLARMDSGGRVWSIYALHLKGRFSA